MTQGQLLGVIGSGVFVAFFVNVVSGYLPGHEWEIASLGAILAIILFLVPTDGLLRRQRHGRARVVRLLAFLLVASYPLILWSVTAAPATHSAALIPNACLWMSSTLLLWTSSAEPNIGEFGMSVASLGGSISCLVAFRLYESQSENFFATAYLVAAGGFVVLSVGLLKDRPQLLRLASLLFGVAAIFFSVPFLLAGTVLGGLAVQMSGIASALFGFSGPDRRPTLSYVSLWMFAVATSAGGGVILTRGPEMAGSKLAASGFVLLTAAFLLLARTLRRRSRTAAGWASACAAGAAAFFGSTFMVLNNNLFGVAVLLAASALLLLSGAVLVGELAYRERANQVIVWLLAKPTEGTDLKGDPATGVGDSSSPSQTATLTSRMKPQDLRFLGLVVVVVAILAVGGGAALQVWRNGGQMTAATCLAVLPC